MRPRPGSDFGRRLVRPLTALTVAYATTLVWATHHPKPAGLLGPNAPSDKTLHFVAYGLLGGLVTTTLLAAGRYRRRSLAVWFSGLLVFAALDELTQPPFGRHAEPLDWLYDAIGLAVGIGCVVVAVRLLRR